jgi:putative flavoprotein involved in K+ transport
MNHQNEPRDGAGPGTPAEWFDTVVVGAGQAGLSMGYHLARLGRSFVILDEHERPGDRWREHYDSLRLYSPAKYDGLPGMPFPASPYTFPSGREMADFLEAYAARMQLPIAAGVKADGLWPVKDQAGGPYHAYTVTAGERRFAAAQVVVATGGQQLPSTPQVAGQLDPGIRQLHSSDYRNPAQLLPGNVLVVGASHSGADIALEVAAAGHKTWLSGPVHGQLPIDLEGRPARQIMRVLWFAANHILTMKTPLGRKMQPEVRAHGGPLLRVKLPDLDSAGVQYVSARTGARDGLPALDDGRALDVTNIIWCTGFRPDFSWIHLPVTGSDGWPRQDRGIAADAPGLYFLGMLFQYAFSSMLVGGVGRDAEYVARHIARHPAARSAAQPSAEPAAAGTRTW